MGSPCVISVGTWYFSVGKLGIVSWLGRVVVGASW